MRKFTIVGREAGLYRLYCDRVSLCWLHPNVFKWPDLAEGEVIQVKELLLQEGAILHREDADALGSPWYSIEVGVKYSNYCDEDFERFTTKRFHLPPGGSMPVSTIKLLLKPRR